MKTIEIGDMVKIRKTRYKVGIHIEQPPSDIEPKHLDCTANSLTDYLWTNRKTEINYRGSQPDIRGSTLLVVDKHFDGYNQWLCVLSQTQRIWIVAKNPFDDTLVIDLVRI